NRPFPSAVSRDRVFPRSTRAPAGITPMFLHAAMRIPALGLLVCLLASVPAAAADWPLWRYDARRRAVSPQELPAKLYLQWVRHAPPLNPAWPDQPKLQFDVAYEPVILGKTVFVGSSREDSVLALDVESGVEKWRFFADGPVRFAPLAWEDK